MQCKKTGLLKESENMPPTNFLREVKSDFRKPFTSTTLYDDEVNKNIILVISNGCVANHHVGSLPLQGLVVSFPSVQYSLYVFHKL